MKNHLLNRIYKKLAVLIFLLIATLFPAFTFAQITTVGGGTGSTSPSGILYGVTGNLHVQTLKFGTGLTFTGTSLGFTSNNISQFTNNSGYLTSLAGAASSTLLSDTNTFSGVNKFTNASSDFSGTWQTFSPAHFQVAGSYLTAAITGLKQTYGTTQTGATQTLATSSDTNLGLTITTTSDTHTFTPTWIGTLADARIASAATWNAKQNALALGAGTVNSNAANALYATATSSLSVNSPLTVSGTFGALIGGANSTISCASCLTANQSITLSGDVSGSGSTAITTAIGANKVTLGMLNTLAANSVIGNITGSAATPTAVATSSLFSFPWSVANGGTNATSQSTNGVAYYDGTRITSNASVLSFVTSGLTVANSASNAEIGLGLSNTNGGVSAASRFRTSADSAIIDEVAFPNANGGSVQFIAQGNTGLIFNQISNSDIIFYTNGGLDRLHILAGGNIGINVTAPVATFQVATSSANATTTLEFGKSGQNKGSCLKLYRTDGSAIYAYVATGATAFTLSTTACATVVGF